MTGFRGFGPQSDQHPDDEQCPARGPGLQHGSDGNGKCENCGVKLYWRSRLRSLGLGDHVPQLPGDLPVPPKSSARPEGHTRLSHGGDEEKLIKACPWCKETERPPVFSEWEERQLGFVRWLRERDMIE